MQIVYARQTLSWLKAERSAILGRSIFLAGPTPRDKQVRSWRPEALRILCEVIRFEGFVFVPEDEQGVYVKFDHDEQIKWEYYGTELAECIAFWIPRDLRTMPAFTTNIEFGRYLDSGKIVLGAPPDAPKMDYMRFWAREKNIPYSETLEETLRTAVARLR